ncbi:hypothetical protein NAPIS_ORF01793 [Vairimorpha apis BRL 01]|uniref:Uncharacterized protein n=1 Tax=Vairimorpha apis BRL 01 TaxID=1037528 RepID=T0L838_9MICR|nr:hypothetical protein NAPIS_ORF01793 [Vairimorpha apis BRL 01]
MNPEENYLQVLFSYFPYPIIDSISFIFSLCLLIIEIKKIDATLKVSSLNFPRFLYKKKLRKLANYEIIFSILIVLIQIFKSDVFTYLLFFVLCYTYFRILNRNLERSFFMNIFHTKIEHFAKFTFYLLCLGNYCLNLVLYKINNK